MMAETILRTWKTVKPHVPLIKFRKGSAFKVESAPSGVTKNPERPASGEAQPLIEDWQLPPNYRRTPLDDKEIDSINSGGAY